MIDSREHLIHVLTEAAEVEHNLLCSYLYAAFSLKRAGEPGLSTAQGEAVERWRKLVLSVALEEMAHLATVNNLLLAIGGAPHLNRPNLPAPPGYHPGGLVVRLTPFDAETLDHFIFLERPETHELADGEGFEGADLQREPPRRAVTPSSIDYETIGALYDAIGEAFERLAARLGEEVLIDPHGRGQLSPEAARLEDVDRVTSLAQALAAIDRIKEQGEGSTGAREHSHYDRFRTIRDEWAELSAADPGFAPAWPAAADPVMRQPAEGIERVHVTEPRAAAQLDLGNAAYGAMLTQLAQVFGCEDPDEQARLMHAAVQLMEVAAGVGAALARLPATADAAEPTAGLTFAMPRNLGRRREPRVDQLAERVAELRAQAERVLSGEQQAKAFARLEACLGAP